MFCCHFYRFPLYCLGLLDTNWMTGGGTVTGTFSRWGHGKQTAVMQIRPVIEGSGSDLSQSPLAWIRFLPYCRVQYLKKTFKGLRDFKHAVLSSVIPTLKILIAYCWSVEKYVRSKKITGFCHNRIWDRLSKTVPYRNTAVQRVFSRLFLACISYPTLLGFKIEIRDARHSFPTPCVLPKVY